MLLKGDPITVEKAKALNLIHAIAPAADLIKAAKDWIKGGGKAIAPWDDKNFKPPGGRGQSFHQDNLYLRQTPVVAAWVALDRADAENGAMEMVRGSHLLGLLPLQAADTDVSVTEIETVLPPYLQRDLITLDPGDTVFFGGLTIHGSLPNRSADRFRRAFICHYVGETAFSVVAPSLSLNTEEK